MSRFREHWLPSLVASILQLLAGALIFKQQVQPWVENLFSLPRDRLVRAAGYIIGLSVLLFGLLRARTLWPWLKTRTRRLRSRDKTVALTGLRADLTPGSLSASLSTPELPPGTASAIAMAMQPPPPRAPLPQFINNSNWMQWEAAQRQHDVAARFAMASAQRGFSAALLSPPSPPTSLVLH